MFLAAHAAQRRAAAADFFGPTARRRPKIDRRAAADTMTSAHSSRPILPHLPITAVKNA